MVISIPGCFKEIRPMGLESILIARVNNTSENGSIMTNMEMVSRNLRMAPSTVVILTKARKRAREH
jgi:hypothetical protein